jgi:diacylglycerol kinase (ATP)
VIFLKYYFIINPIAGKQNSTNSIEERLAVYQGKVDYEVYITSCPGDATLKVAEIADANEQSENPLELCFVACGGDGTCHEVATGLALKKHVAMAILPTGSCNDFLKTFPGYDFMNLDKLFEGKVSKVDLIKVNEEYCLNVTNIGYDAKVNADQIKFRAKDKTVKKAYYHAILHNLLKPLGNLCTVRVDDKVIFDKKALLITLANGKWYGSCFECAPHSKVDDGLIDISVVKKISIIHFARLIKYYKRGEHLERKEFKKIITYCRGKRIRIESNDTLCYCIDGDTYFGKTIDVEVFPRTLSFVFPKRKEE